MSKNSRKTFADVRAAFENRSVLKASRKELEELLAAAACEKTDDVALRAQVHEMSLAMRQFIADRRGAELRQPSVFAIAALLLFGAALVWCGTQAYYAQRASTATSNALSSVGRAINDDAWPNDARTTTTIAELAKRAPTLRTGTLQAWWAGEQARQVQRLEAQAKRQTLAGDYAGAARSANRADAIRNAIPALAESERTPAR